MLRRTNELIFIKIIELYSSEVECNDVCTRRALMDVSKKWDIKLTKIIQIMIIFT